MGIDIAQSLLDKGEIALNEQSKTVINQITAFDIAGQNKADLGATRQAFDLVVRMAKTHRALSDAASQEKISR